MNEQATSEPQETPQTARPLLSGELGVAHSAADTLTENGVFKGAHGLEGLANAQEFWDRQPYGTRLYYGDGIADYLHRDVLRAAVRALTPNVKFTGAEGVRCNAGLDAAPATEKE